MPEHIAIIMDGNRRWAKERGLESKFGHKAGAEALENLTYFANDIGIKYLTVLILVSTVCLLIGSYFMQDEKRAWSALAFTGLMAAFMLAIVGPLIFFKSKIAQSIPIAYSLALLVVACTASLVIGAWAMNEFGFLDILKFGVLLLGFIFGILNKSFDL